MTNLRPLSTNGRALEQVQCPICTSAPSRLFAKSDDLMIVRCTNCGLLYVNPRLSSEERRRHYAVEYMPTTEVVQKNFGSRRELALKFDAEKIQEHKATGKILDIGCAGGAFLRYFDSSKWERQGVEPAHVAAEHARETYAIQVFEGELAEAHYPNRYFDVVTVIDALMLMPDPRAELREIYRVLDDKGVLGVEIPGLDFRLAKNTGVLSKILYGKWTALNPSEHLYYFSDTTLRKLLDSTGFVVEQVHLSFPALYGSSLRRAGYLAFFGMAKLLFYLSRKKLNFATKVLYVARKAA